MPKEKLSRSQRKKLLLAGAKEAAQSILDEMGHGSTTLPTVKAGRNFFALPHNDRLVLAFLYVADQQDEEMNKLFSRTVESGKSFAAVLQRDFCSLVVNVPYRVIIAIALAIGGYKIGSLAVSLLM